MESTKRLREYAETKCGWGVSPEVARHIKEFVDAIKREAMEERTAAYNEGYDAGFASADDWAAQHEDAMAEHGWVRLPVDAEGVPWRIGDVIAWPDESGLKPVIGIGKDWLFYVDSECEYKADWTVANDKRHHHEPTVEDVLREFVERLDEIGSEDDCVGEAEQECRACVRRDIAAAYADYAAKLRLAGDE